MALPDFPMCEEDDSFFVVFYKSNYKSLGALGIKESLSYFSKIHIPIHVRHSLLEFFRGLPDSDDQKLYSIFVNRWKTFKEREN